MITYFADLSKVLVFLINVTGITLIITIFAEQIQPILKRIFILMTILMFIWVDCAFLARIVDQTDTGLIFIKIAWSITPLLFVLLYSFIINFIQKTQKYKVFTFISYVFGVILMFVTLISRFVIADIMYEDGVLKILYGSLVWVFFGAVAFYTAASFYILLRHSEDKSVSKEIRSRLKYVTLGLSIFFVCNAVFNIVYPVFLNTFNLYEFGDYTTVIFLSLVAYAVVTHSFFGVKVVLASFITAFIGSFLFLDLIIFSQGWVQRILKSIILVFYIPFGYLLVRSVMTEVKNRKRLEELTAKLKDLDKQKDEFISMAAHELRSPLTAIKGYVSMIVEGDTGNVSQKARNYLTDTGAVTDRLIRLVNNMLNVSRIEKGSLALQMEQTDLIKAAQETYYSFQFEAERKGLKFKLDIPDGVNDDVYADPDRLREIIGNLVSNAIKYTNEGSVTIKIRQIADEKLKLEVVDTGPGISKEEQAKLFQKFYRAESTAGKTMGTGLGLYISRLLLEKFGGKVGLKSEVGKGSTFWFEVPIYKGQKSKEVNN